MQKNYYRILQIDPTADPLIVKSAYRTLMLDLKSHPDHGGNIDYAQAINEAYEILKNPEKRKQYDKSNFIAIRKNKAQKQFFQLRCHHCNQINTISLTLNETEMYHTICTSCNKALFSDFYESRQYPRYKCELNVYIQSANNKVKLRGKCSNFSRNGMQLLAPIPIKLDETVLLRFPHHKDFSIIAKIIRIEEIENPQDKNRYRHGVVYIQAQCE